MAEPRTSASTTAMPLPGRPRVVAAAVDPARRGPVVAALNRVVAGGGSAVLVTADGGERPAGLDAAVQVLDLRRGERRLGVNQLITRDPMRVVRRLRHRPSSGPSPVWALVSGSKPYRMIRPWLLWRVLRQRLEVLRVGDVDHVILVHQNSWPIAWQLHRLNPAVSVAYEVPDSLWERAGRPVPPEQP